MADSDLSFSSGVAHQAARYFYSRRYLTKFGVLQIASTAVMIVFALVIYRYMGANWLFGVLMALPLLNATTQITMIVCAPKIHAKLIAAYQSRIGHVSTSDQSFTIAVDGNVMNVAWTRIRYLWPQRDFIVLGLSFFTMVHLPTEGMSPDVRTDFEKRASRPVGA